jgi:hypothetical protein
MHKSSDLASTIKFNDSMKKILLSFCFISAALFSSFAQNKKAEKDSAAMLQFRKAVAAIEAKDFVIIVDSYVTGGGTFETNTDNANFLSYEKEFVFLQGQIVAENNYTNKLTVSDFNQVADKKGNIRIIMQVRGFYITAKVEIFLKKGGNYADVIITPTRGSTKRFSGVVIPRRESKYFKRSGGV